MRHPFEPSALASGTPRTALVAIGGPTGVGKTSLINALVRERAMRYVRAPALTSRPRRLGEDDSEYQFVEAAALRHMHAEGLLVNLDEVYGHLYGIPRAGLASALADSRWALKEVHPRNHAALEEAAPGTVSVLVLPASLRSPLSGSPDDASRKGRQAEDRAFYSGLDLTAFDIVLRVDHERGVEAAAAELHASLDHFSRARLTFPRPRLIDDTNRRGYGSASSEFIDSERPTTRYFHQLSQAFFRDALSSLVAPGDRCLELGPGSGWLRAAFSWPPVHYTAVDIAEAMLSHHAETQDAGLVRVTSARTLPFLDGAFDVAFASLCDPFCYPEALRELRRVLRPGGVAMMSCPSREWSDAVRPEHKRDKTQFGLRNGIAEVYSFTFYEEELEALLKSAGFASADVTPVYGEDSLTTPAPPHITSAAAALRCRVGQLRVINTVVARTGERLTLR